MTETNPFLDTALAIRWSQLTADRVAPAIETALAEAQANLDAIRAVPPAAVTFDNSVAALERAARTLRLSWGKVSHLMSVADAPDLRRAYNTLLPRISEFYASILLDQQLWAALRAFAATPAAAALTGVRRRLFEETMADFREAGADLPAPQRARLEKIESELSQLTQKYSENVLDATNAWERIVDDPARLAGLPEHARETARRDALAKGHGSAESPRWRFTLQEPSIVPVLSYADDTSLRREVWSALSTVGVTPAHDNRELVHRILALRQEKATLLGRPHFPDQVLARRMARNGATARQFLEDLHARVRDAFAQECAELEAFKAERTGTPPGPLAPWEVAYWAEKLRRERYDFDEEALRPYFPLPRVLEGLFEITRRLFGVEVIARPPGEWETWHPDVACYQLRDADGRHLGSFYADWHPRESKRSGAWMNYLHTGEPTPGGPREPHLGLICGNLTPPAGDRPALLTHREVETVFHEFGHLLHHLFGEVEFSSLNGVNVAWDFVELPSQILENWCWERESLDLFARHYQTAAPIPAELFAKMTAARNFRAANATMRQLALGMLDLSLHLEPSRYLGRDIEAELQTALRGWLVPTEPPAPTIVHRFGHLFADPVGYAAGYYSYKWAEVLDADAFGRFKREGIFNGATGRAFREQILSRGNSEEPMELYKRFMGRGPDLQPLLERSGLAATTVA
jgi:oligopeptidase A